MSAKNTYLALQKEYPTKCLYCDKFIPEDQQSSKKQFCNALHRQRFRRKEKRDEIEQLMRSRINALYEGKDDAN